MFGHVSIPYQSHEKVLCCQQYPLSEIWANTKLNLLIYLLPIWHLFFVGSIDDESTEDMGIKKTLASLQLIIPEILRILLTFSYFPTNSEIWSPPNLPLPPIFYRFRKALSTSFMRANRDVSNPPNCPYGPFNHKKGQKRLEGGWALF